MFGNDPQSDNRCVKMATVTFFLLSAAFLLIPDKLANAATPLSLTVNNNSTHTLTTAQSPYVVNYLIVDEGSSLIIDPGVVLKLYRTAININGNLYINGTSEDPVYITSYKDDSVGGDTNGDGVSTAPASGDWIGLMIAENQSNGSATINHAVIRYGGYSNCSGCMMSNVYIGGGTVAINDTQVSNSEFYGVRQRSGLLSINSSELDHNQYGLSVDSYSFYPDATIEYSDIHDNFYGIVVSCYGGNMTANYNTFTDNNRAINMSASVDFSHEGNTATGNGSSGIYISGSLGQDQNWNNDLVYVVSNLTIPSGVTLTVGPGTVVKNYYQSYIVVQGDLLVQGTAQDRVYFTAFNDDSVGGDTNNDGTSYSSAGYWDGMLVGLSGSTTVELDNVVIRYGGGNFCGGISCYQGALYINDGQVSLSNSEISHSGLYGIRQSGGSIDVDSTEFGHNFISYYGYYSSSASFVGSSFHDSGFRAIYSNSPNGVTATGNWWNSASGPFNSTYNPYGTGDGVSDNVTFSPWLNSDPL